MTDTPRPHCSVQLLELRHRAHARVEDRIRCGKDSGLRRFPSRVFAINAAGLELALVGIDLLAWTAVLPLDDHHALTEPKRLRYRLLHVAARITRTARRTHLRIAERWPWANVLTAAFAASRHCHTRHLTVQPVYKGHGQRRPTMPEPCHIPSPTTSRPWI